MIETFVTNTPTCSRSGLPVQNCQCGGHGNANSDKPQPIPTVEVNYAEPEPEPEAWDFGYTEHNVVNTVLDPWQPEDDDALVVNAEDRPTPIPIYDFDYSEMAAEQQ